MLDNLRLQANNGNDMIQVLLDMSAAIDTVSHAILVERLINIGVRGRALEWLQSYLTGRQQTVTLAPYTSKKSQVHYGVPQGSSISPILFNIYLKPLLAIIKSFGINVINYADDTQLVFSLAGKQAVPLEIFQERMRQTADWLKRNSLQFNGGKTEVMYCSPARIPKPLLAEFRLSPEEEPLAPVNTVRILEVIMDSNL